MKGEGRILCILLAKKKEKGVSGKEVEKSVGVSGHRGGLQFCVKFVLAKLVCDKAVKIT